MFIKDRLKVVALLTLLLGVVGLVLWNHASSRTSKAFVSEYSGAEAVDQVFEKTTQKIEKTKKTAKINPKAKAPQESDLANMDVETKKILAIEDIDYEKDLEQASDRKLSDEDDYSNLLKARAKNDIKQKSSKNNQTPNSDTEYERLLSQISDLEIEEKAAAKNEEKTVQRKQQSEAKMLTGKLRKYDSLKSTVERQAREDLRNETFIDDSDYQFDYSFDLYDTVLIGDPFGSQ